VSTLLYSLFSFSLFGGVPIPAACSPSRSRSRRQIPRRSSRSYSRSLHRNHGAATQETIGNRRRFLPRQLRFSMLRSLESRLHVVRFPRHVIIDADALPVPVPAAPLVAVALSAACAVARPPRLSWLCCCLWWSWLRVRFVVIPVQVPSDLALARDGGETPPTPKQPHHALPSFAVPLGA